MQHEPDNKYPLVSVICFCRNGAKTIRRCIDAILAQDYPNIEVIVQDGTSTDGTLEILHGYGDKIGLVSEPDNGPNDAMFCGLCRMKGEFFVFSLADEAMLSHAVSWGVENLKKHPKAAAIYGDYYVTDINGNITGVVKPNQWDFESYFCSETTPSLCASFFRKSCYDKIGFQEYTASDEFDLWINLGARFPIHYVPCRQPAAKYAVYPGELSLQKDHQIKRLNSRKRAIQKLCGDPNTPEPIRLMQDRALASLVVWNVANLCKAGAWDQVKELTLEAFKVGPNTEKLQYLAGLIYNHIIELCQKGDLKEALEFLDLLKNSNVVGKKLDYQREQILHKLAKNRSRYKTRKEICMHQKNIPIKDRQFTSLINTKSPADFVVQETKFSFVMIVLNGMPFIEYSLKSVYDFAHEIIIVEGAVKDCMFAANPDGSSKDGTVEFIKSFPDPENKIRFIQGKWPEKCEMQNEALKHVTGNYVWLIDSDEVYKKNDLEKIKEILKNDPSLTQVNFIPDSFWKGLDYIFVSSMFFEDPTHYRRLFKYVPGAVFTTHRPPTMVWPGSNKTTEQMNLLDGSQTHQMGIIFYHYSYVLDEQVKKKTGYYLRRGLELYGTESINGVNRREWFNECFLKWTCGNRSEIEAKYAVWMGDKNSRTEQFKGTHPQVMIEYARKYKPNGHLYPSIPVMQNTINAIEELKEKFHNTCLQAIETGTIRTFHASGQSTLIISRTLGPQGNLISVDIDPNAIRMSKNFCYDTSNIEWIESDSIAYLKQLKNKKFHFAFLDSVNDKDFIFEEFHLMIPMMLENSVLMIDDAGITPGGHDVDNTVAALKGHKVWRFLKSCGARFSVIQLPGSPGTQLKISLEADNLKLISDALGKYNKVESLSKNNILPVRTQSHSGMNGSNCISKCFISPKAEIFHDEQAHRLLKQCNDSKYLTNDGIVKVNKDRWETAQYYEKYTWMVNGINAKDDRNFEHQEKFGNYQTLSNHKFEKAIELGCGPFTNMRLILSHIEKPKKVTLLDPLIKDYLTHPNCSYKNGKLCGIPVEMIPSTIEEFIPSEQYDLVVLANVLEHCFDIPRVFDVILSCLKPGGILVFADVVFKEKYLRNYVKNTFDTGHPIRVAEDFVTDFLNRNFVFTYKKKFCDLQKHPYRLDFYCIGHKKVLSSHPIVYTDYSNVPQNGDIVQTSKMVIDKPSEPLQCITSMGDKSSAITGPQDKALRSSQATSFDHFTPVAAKKKHALISYITAPLRMGPDCHPFMFSNPGIARNIVKVLVDMGYIVDAIEYNCKDFKSDKTYDLFIGHSGVNWEYLSRNVVDDAVKIYFSTGIYWREFNHREAERFETLKQRRGVQLPYDRWIKCSEEFANHDADGIICLGHQGAADSYNHFPICININNACYTDDYFDKSTKDYNAGRNRFVFFGSSGSVHKGLDRTIEAFAQLDVELYCVGSIEPHFADVYKDELAKHPNIHLVGWVDLRSPQFYKLMDSCNCVILPSCAEGQPGSVLECMNRGLIPILSREANIDVKDFGIKLPSSSVEDIVDTIKLVASQAIGWHREKSIKTRQAILCDYSEEAFYRNFRTAVEKIIEQAPAVRSQRTTETTKVIDNPQTYLDVNKNNLGMLLRGAAYLKSHNCDDKAAKLFHCAAAIEPSCVTAIYELAAHYANKGQIEKAAEFVKRTLELCPVDQQSLSLSHEIKQNVHLTKPIMSKPVSLPANKIESSCALRCSNVKNILWVRTDSIGDNVLASSMLPHIRAKYKDAKITVLCQRHIAELYDSCPFVDDTIVFNRKRALKDQQYREEIIKQLHILKPDISLNSVYSREPITDLFALNCGAGQRIAFDGNLCNTTAEIKHKCDQFYTMLLPSDGEQKPELQRHRDFLHGIGIEATSLKPMVWITAEDEEFAEKFFRENQLNQKNTVALFPTAQHQQKNYEKYEYILKNLEGFDFIILGDSEAQAYTDKIQKSIPNRCYNLAGKTTIRQMAAIIRNCCVYLGSDSAGAHIACAVDTPNIVILGGGHFGRFIPYSPLTSTVCMPLDCYGCSWGTCNYQRSLCVKDIAPEVIIKAFQQTFAKSSEKYKIFVHDDSIWKPHLHQHCRKILDRFLEMDKVEIISVKSPPSEIQNNLLTDGHYTKIVPMSEGIALETFRNEEFLKGLDVELDGTNRPTVWVTQADREVAEQLLNRRGIKEPIVIIPFAQQDIRNWPVKNWAKLISMYPDVPVIICGIAKDKPAAEKIISLANHPNIHNLCGLTTVRQFAALIAKSRLSISSESGAAHIAAAANRPHVVLIGGGHFGRFIPYSSQTKLVYNKMDCYNCNWQCKYGQDISCIATISVDMVERAVNEVFGTIRPVPVFDNSKVIIQAKKDIADKSDFLVSAIVSTYNSEKFIRGCLDDLIDQSLFKKGQLEIVVVNSGSQQNEEAFVEEFQQKYDNIKYIKTEERETVYQAWNRGIKVASGKYITNANTDDRHRQDALQVMADTLLANPDIALIYGDQIYTNTPDDTFASNHGTKMTRRPDYNRERLLFGCCVGSQPMWRKSLHSEFGYFDDTLSCAGDWDFWLRVSSKYNLKHIPEFLGLYYYNENGIEHSRKIHSLYERYIVGKRHGNPYISVIPLYTSKDNPLVSVIMAAYNAAEHIAEAIESVLIQNYRNFELIVVDDGSTDNTSDIVAGFKDDKIRCFYKENAGPASARNLGITKSQGLFLIHLDSDDMITPDFITKHLQEFEKHPGADLVYCDDCLIEENSKPIRVIERPEYKDRRLLIRDLFHCGFPAVPFRTCIRRSVFDKIGFFDEGLLIAEDYDMMRRFVKHGLKIHHLKGALYLRRMTSGSLSRNYSTQKAKCHFDVIKRYIDTFTYDELFPDVAWDQIALEMRQLHAKCLTAGTYLAIGQEYVKTNAPEYSRIAFDLACSELNGCVKMDPENQDLRQLLQKSKLIRAKYTEAPQQVVF